MAPRDAKQLVVLFREVEFPAEDSPEDEDATDAVLTELALALGIELDD